MESGAVLVMDKLTMHASLPNLSEDIRWSVDLRYQPGGEPTGWPWFPGFVALSRSAPESVLANAAAWPQPPLRRFSAGRRGLRQRLEEGVHVPGVAEADPTAASLNTGAPRRKGAGDAPHAAGVGSGAVAGLVDHPEFSLGRRSG